MPKFVSPTDLVTNTGSRREAPSRSELAGANANGPDMPASVRSVSGEKRSPLGDVTQHSPTSPDHPSEEHVRMSSSAFVHVVDDDMSVCESLGELLRSMDYQVTLHGSAAEFLNAELRDAPSCLVLDVRLPRTSGLELQDYLTYVNIRLPIILMTGYGDIPMSVKAMKAGAVDFLTKPIRNQDLLDAVAAAIRIDQNRRQKATQIAELRERYALLTPRERQVVGFVASGLMNKQIANELSISEVTVKMHRSSALRKLRAKSVAMLIRMVEALDIGK